MAGKTSATKKETKVEQQDDGIIRIRKGEKKQDVETTPLFSIVDEKGKEKVYSIPTEVSTQVAVKYLRDLTKVGEQAAVSMAMETVLGEEAFNALADSKDITDEHMKAILKRVQELLLGAMEKMQGNS